LTCDQLADFILIPARAIQDQLLKDFATRSEFSDWFNREDHAPKAPVVMKPNPRNAELDEKMAALQARIKRSVSFRPFIPVHIS
jgi:kinetochore protein Mis13/DSN1